MANETTRIKDLSPITTVTDSDVFPYDGIGGTKGIAFENLCEEIRDRIAASPQEIKQYLNIQW